MLLGFENSKAKPNSGNKTLYFNDGVLGVGKVIFNFNADILSKLPKLETI
jgi:hypothetical protein